MGDYDLVFPRVKAIEGLLESRWGASGRGLHEKLSSVEHKLDSTVVAQGRFIASVRNKVAHEDGYRLDDPAGFAAACERVETYLRQASPPPSPRKAPAVSQPLTSRAAVSATGQPMAPPMTGLELWRGQYVLWLWLGFAAYFFLPVLELGQWTRADWPLTAALVLTTVAGMRTVLSDELDEPNPFTLLFPLLPALFLAATIGRKLGGLSGGILIFCVSLLGFFLLCRSTALWPLFRVGHWISRGLYKAVTYSFALTVTLGILWAIIQFFIKNWRPA